MKFYNKLKWILGIMIVFVLIVTTNLIDRNNFIRVKGSVETLYEDRLKANDLLFDLSQAIHEKEVAVLKSDTLFFSARNAALNREIQTYIDQYEQTQLTSDESRLFNKLREDLRVLEKEENAFIGSSYSNNSDLLISSTNIKASLKALSKIQLLEGRRQVSISNKAIDTVELYTHIEIYLLVFFAIAIQILILYSPKKS